MATAASYCSYLEQYYYCYWQQTRCLMTLIELIITAVMWLTSAIVIVDVCIVSAIALIPVVLQQCLLLL